MHTDQSSLWIYDGGFSTAEIETGVAAAKAVLDAAGVTTDQAHEASQLRADDQPYNAAAADAWDAAEAAAIEAAAQGWARCPAGACLALA